MKVFKFAIKKKKKHVGGWVGGSTTSDSAQLYTPTL